MHRKATIIGFALSLVVTIGCGAIDEPTGTSDADGDQSSDCADCTDWNVEEKSEEPEEPEELTEGLGACHPEAVEWSGTEIPEIPAGVHDESCPLEEQIDESDVSWERDEVITRWQWEGSRLEKTERHEGQPAVETTFEFDDGHQQLHRIERRHEYINPQAFADFSHRVWEFDNEQLVYFRKDFGDIEDEGDEVFQWREINQEWNGDRLVRRTEDDKYRNSDPSHVEYEWTYDDAGRLVEATRINDEDQQDRTTWTYDDNMPVEVERFIEDIPVERQSWEFDDDEILRSRHIAVDPEGLDGESLDSDANRSPATLDTYPLNRLDDPGIYQELTDPWEYSNAHRRAGDDECFRLPTTAGHGYPIDELDYRMTFIDDGDLSDVVRHGYGIDGPTYASGPAQPKWYGHVGAGTAWNRVNSPRNFLTFDITYDDRGRMIDEEMAFEKREGDAELVTVERTREFASGNLEQDAVTVESDDESLDATLHFARDDDGNLTERTRTVGGETVSRQQWSYDDGIAVDLEVEAVFYDSGNYWLTYYPMVDQLLDDHETTTDTGLMVTRVLDDEQRVVFRDEEAPRHDRRAGVETTWSEDGKTEEISSIESGNTDNVDRTIWEYDDKGRVIREAIDYGDDGTFGRDTRYDFDESDRLIEKAHFQHGTLHNRMTRHYACHE